ncbi:MAG: hypothetical protein JWN78_387 [Bacteroidota bacterium]|nr:hypothetical protein [Bacteroidota bacterium]
MNNFTLPNLIQPIRKNISSVLFGVMWLMFHVNASAQADLEVSKFLDRTTPAEGDTITYTIVAMNHGPSDVRSTSYKDMLPSALTYISSHATKGTYNASTGVWGAFDLKKDQEQTLTITARVNAGTTGSTVENEVYVYNSLAVDPDVSNDTATAIFMVLARPFNCLCNLQYPDNSNLPRSAVLFNESEVLRASDPGPTTCGSTGTKIKAWYSDEHALTLGVHRVIVKNASGTTTTDYPIAPTPSSPTCISHPLVGTTIQSGDQTGNDVAAGGGRPLWPAIFITDLTVNGAGSRIGDWQQGGIGIPPHQVCGTWKGAIRTVDNTRNPAVVTVTPDADPVKNVWAGIPDVPPGGFASLTNQGYGAEVSWNTNELGLIPGHIYRLQFMVHDGDQNKTGGDVGETCTTISIPESCPDITAFATPPRICRGDSSVLGFTGTGTVVGWFIDNSSASGCQPEGLSLGTGNTLTVHPVNTATYLVIVQNSSGSCFDTSCVTVTVNPKPTLTLTSGPICDNSQTSYSITLAINGGTGPFTATATAGTATVVGNVLTVSGIPSGSGTIVRVTDANGCISDPYNQAPHTCCPVVTASASPDKICVGDSSVLSFTGTPGVTVVGWFQADISGCSLFSTNLGTGNTLTVRPSSTSAYVVIVKNSNGSCNDTSNCVTVTVRQKPTLTLTSGPICDNTQTSYSITLAIGGGVGPFTATATAGTATVVGNTLTVSGIPSGFGTIVKVTDANGCVSDPYNQAPHTCCPFVTASASPAVICAGASSTLSFTGTPNVIVVGWFKANAVGGCVATGANLGTGNTLVVSPATTTSYVVVVANADRSCNDTSNCVTLTVNPRPTLTLVGQPICDVTQSFYTINLVIGGSGASPFTATASVGTTTVVGNLVTVTNIPSGLGTVVTARDANGCISDPYNQAPHTCCPFVTASASPSVICQGFSSTLSFTGTPGVVVVGWFQALTANGCIPVGQNLGRGNTLLVSPSTTTSYVVIVSNSNNSCNDTSNCVTVTVNPRPTLTLIGEPVCDATQSSYSITLSIGLGTGPFTATATAGTATVVGNILTVSGIPSGLGTTVTVTDSKGCISDPYNQPPHTCCPFVTASASPSTICQGQSSILSFTGTPGVIVIGWFQAIIEGSCIPVGPSLGTGNTLTVTPGSTTTYVVVVTNANHSCNDTSNCVRVTVNPSYGNIIVDSTICEGSSVTMGGNTYTLSGNYIINLHTTLGCDSIIHLNLTVNPKKFTDVRSVICFGEHITVGGQIFSTSVTDSIIILRTSKGCDSVITVNLQVLQQDTTVTNRTICQGQVVQIGDSTYSKAGTYYIPFRNNQCTGIVKLILVVNDSTLSRVSREICEGGVTVVGGQVFNTAGTYRIVIANSKGCDSIITLSLSVNPKKNVTIDSAICRGESVTIGTQVFSTTGTFQVFLQTTKGCDSLVTLHLIVNTAGDTTVVNQSICNGDSTTVGTQVFKVAGTYYIQSLNGRCINIIQLNLTVRPKSDTTINKAICRGDAIVIGGQTFTQTGTYTVHVLNSVGCDSMIKLVLDVSQGGVKNSLDTTICFGTSVTYAGQTFSTTGSYQIIFPSGICRDTLLLNLVVNPKIEVTIDSTICEGSSVTLGSNAFTLSGNYTITLISSKGCDSTVHLNLTVNPVKHTDVRSVICFGEHITVGGQVFSTSVTDSVIVLNTSKGCDSIITLNLVVLQQDTITMPRTICSGDVVQIGDSTYTAAGTYYVPFSNNQCTGIVRLIVKVNQPTDTTIRASICEGSIAVVGGHIFNTSGTYPVIVRNSLGCDSVITLILTVNPKKSTTIDTAICRGESITVGTLVFTTTGTYQVTLATSQGCDSMITLNLIVLSSGDTTIVPQSICQGDTATVNGQHFTTAGTYFIQSLNGRCTNIIQLVLTVRPVSDSTIFRSICEGQAVVVGSQTFTTAGTHVVTLQNSVGCDSIVTLVLDVSQGGTFRSLDTTICFGGSVTFAGQTFSTTGSYQIIFPSGACRDTLLLNLVVNPKIEITIERNICEGSSVAIGGYSFNLTGDYTVQISNATGCDSTIHLHLIVRPVKHTNIDAVLCSGEQVLAGGQVFTTNVTDSVIVLQTAQGCDSILTINLVFLKQDTIVTNRTICDEDFVDIGGHIFTQAGTYYIPFQNNQCTGIVQLNLTVNLPSVTRINRTICDGDFTVVEGHIFNAAGFYTVVVPNSMGCDSIIIVRVTVTPKQYTVIDSTICTGHTVTIGGQTFGATGSYTVSLTSAATGCDSIVTLNLTVITDNQVTFMTQTICEGDSVVIQGTVLTVPSVYTFLVNNGTCQGTLLVLLNVNKPTDTTINAFLCDGQAIVVAGNTYNQSGTYTIKTTNSVGCDSTITLNIDISTGGTKTQLDTTICFGGKVTFAGQTFSTTGTYQIIYPVNVCRDTLLLNLVVNPKIEITIERNICEGNSVTLGGYVFNLTGDYTVLIHNATGCDSTVHLHLIVRPVKHTNVDAVLCDGEQVVVGGQVFTHSISNHIITLQTSEGCDSIITVNIVVLDFDTTVTNRTICQGDFVDIGGHIFTTTGTYYITFTNGQCTGTVQLNLTVNQPSAITTLNQTICEGGFVVVAGHIYSAAGVYSITVPNAFGCDSTIALNLTVTPTAHTTIDTAICSGQTFAVGAQIFNTSGTHVVTLVGATGCDSIVTLNLSVLSGDTTTLNQSICSDDSITIGGQVFSSAGTYFIPVVNGVCNSVIKLVLDVRGVSKVTIDKAICEGQAVVIGGQTFTTTGTYAITLQNSAGCDSLITLNLNVSIGGTKSSLDTTICFGHSLTFAGQTFSSTGTYQIIYPVDVCRDTLLLNLIVDDKIDFTIERNICEGGSVVVGGNTFSLTGYYTVVIRDTTGLYCDSTVHLNLIVRPVKHTNIDAVLCDGQQVLAGGQVFTTSVTDSIIVLQSSEGCDSIIKLNLVFLKQDTIVTDRKICAGDFVDIGGHIFTQAGTYYIPFQNGQCLGVVKLNLIVNDGTEGATVVANICEGGFVTVNGQIYSQAGLYTITTINSLGCDSIYALRVFVNPISRKTIDTAICNGQSVMIGADVFFTTGTHLVTLTNSKGCDSIVTLNLTVLNGDTTLLNQTICSSDSITVGGQVFSSAGTFFIPVVNGNCPSIIKLVLVTRAVSKTTLNETICDGQAIVVGGQTFNTTGDYTVIVQNSVGCDSIINLHLDVSIGGTKTTLDTAVCFGKSVTFAGQTFTATGTYQIIYPVNVCRDTLLLHLTVNSLDTVPMEAVIACNQQTVIFRDSVYTAGVYFINISNPNNPLACDSVLRLNVRFGDCPPLHVDIIDTIPIKTDTIHCNIANPSATTTNTVYTSCDGATSGTSPYGTWSIVNGCFIYHAGPIKTPHADSLHTLSDSASIPGLPTADSLWYVYFDAFCIKATDTVTHTDATTSIFITLTGFPPVAVNDTTITTINTPVVVHVLVNDTSYDQDPLALPTTGGVVTQPTHGTAADNGDGTITYTPANGYTGVDSFQYQICDPPGAEGCDTAWVFITIKQDNCEIPNAFSPNGDGINDYFKIPCFSGPIEFSVYNRWGIEVYRNDAYLNDWDGKYKGAPLPDGTYYYVLKYITTNNEDINRAGFITLHR